MKFARQLVSILSRAVGCRLFMTALAMGACASVSAGEQDDYLRGYADALLDSRYPGLGRRVQAVKPDAGVTLTSRTCLGPSQKRDVAHLLIKSGQEKTVFWALSADCDKARSAPESDAAAPAPIDIHALPETELSAPWLADPRQPRFSMSYQRYRGSAREFAAASVALGEYFGLATGLFGEYGSSQVGIQGAVFALFNLDAPSRDLINADYWIGFSGRFPPGPRAALIRAACSR